jgi:DNA repair protein RadB
MSKYMLSPNNSVIEALIGKYLPGNLTTIYGNAASGKTTCCILASISASKRDGRVVFVDTENGFNIGRLKQLSGGNYKKILDDILLIQPETYEQQHKTILNLKKICKNEKIKLVVVDTIGKYYRVQLNKEPKKTNKMMVSQLRTLVQIARDLDKVVLLTNQVYSKMDTADGLKMVGGSMMEHMNKVLIELKKIDSERTAKLVKYKTEKENTTDYNLGKTIKFEIKEKGFFLLS